jgi:hypothetical protein
MYFLALELQGVLKTIKTVSKDQLKYYLLTALTERDKAESDIAPTRDRVVTSYQRAQHRTDGTGPAKGKKAREHPEDYGHLRRTTGTTAEEVSGSK